MTAAARVAGIPELLENILLHLPLRDLFLAQRMNRTARNIIEKSTQIQQALFLRPYGPGPVTVLGAQHPVMECESKEVCEPEEWGGCMPQGKTGDICWSCPTTGREITHVVTSPLLPFIPGDCKNFHYLDWTTYELLPDDPIWSRPEASWRRMLITQPPLFQATVEHCGPVKHDHVFQASSQDLGVTAGDCFESALAHGTTLRDLVMAGFVYLEKTTTVEEALEEMRRGQEDMV